MKAFSVCVLLHTAFAAVRRSAGLLRAVALLVVSGVCGGSVASAQETLEWTWIGGSSSANQRGVYGTLGTPAAGNIPGARQGASTWTDSSGHLWLFGGDGYDASGSLADLNDLWEFNPSTNQWAWMAGSSSGNQLGSYGTMGTPAAGNTPGARSGASSWTDSSGHLWLFGGYGVDGPGSGIYVNGNLIYLNDVWEFNPSTNQWTWMGGGNGKSVFGTLGIPASGNVPGMRWDASTWTDSSGHLWLFGGDGYDASDDLLWLNEYWEFNPSTNQWAWMGGGTKLVCASDDDPCGEVGTYGTRGTYTSGGIPGGRESASSWNDGSGHFWLFGGIGLDVKTNDGPLDELWEFIPSTNEWTWMGGRNALSCNVDGICSQPGVYGTFGTPAVGNIPPGRYGASRWTDENGNLWLFGGWAWAYLNDLWEFSPSTNEWAWMGGSSSSNQPGVYGMPGMPAAGNTPGGRSGAATWTSSSGSFWLFGGSSLNTSGATEDLNDDLWMLSASDVTPVVSLSTTSLSFGSVQVNTASASQSATLTNTGNEALSISGIAVTGKYASSFDLTNTCGSTLAAGASCTIHEHFAPTVEGPLTATLTINDNASRSSQSIALSGTGLAPEVSLSATSLSFGLVPVNTAGASQSVTLTNTGNEGLLFSSISVSGASSMYQFANNCGSSLAAGASCTIHGHFAPTILGDCPATITIKDNAASSPQSILLSGTGEGPGVALSAATLSFGSVDAGSSSASQLVTLRNSGDDTLYITSIHVTGADASSYIFANNCGFLAPGDKCTIHGHFSPTQSGVLTAAAVTITDNAIGSPQGIALRGTGVSAPGASLSATSLSFGTVKVGTGSASQSVTLTNNGNEGLSITSIGVTGADASSFVFANSCGSSLAAGNACTIHGHFAPAATGPLTATITITDTATGSPQHIALSGTGQ
jgi:N-acetylneuraminic acid mutarotase